MLLWISLETAGLASPAGSLACRWTVLRHAHGSLLLAPHAQRCTMVGPLGARAIAVAAGDADGAGDGMRITAAAVAVASRSAGSLGDEILSEDWRWIDRATKSAAP
jgi:hypothetical protein